MIITKTPLRISLGGGGTDLKSYYEDYESFFISAAIDKYIYISLHEAFQPRYIVKYSHLEKTERISEIKNDLIRETLKLHDIKPGVEITSFADLPQGTGLGSSGSFNVGLLKAIYTKKSEPISQYQLAEEACHIEIERLRRPVGKQDQFIAAYGGINTFTIDKKGKVTVSPLHINQTTLHELEDNLTLFFTGMSRSASSLLKIQDTKSKENNKEMLDNLHFTKKLGVKSKKVLEAGDLENFSELMNIHWERKKKRSQNMSNEVINKWYETGMANGAIGGKLIGAGGGGFLMFYAKDKKKLVKAMNKEGLKETRFRFDFEGSRTIING